MDAYSKGVAPINFVSRRAGETQNPYTAPIYNNIGTTASANTPTTGSGPDHHGPAGGRANTGSTDTMSYTEFQVTFTSVFGTTVDAPMVVTGYTPAKRHDRERLPRRRLTAWRWPRRRT